MSNFGHQRERQLAELLRQEGWYVLRSAGSLGCADLIALKAGRHTRMIEVKGTTRGPFSGFPPADRAAILEAAEVAGCEAWLVWWPKRGKPSWLAPPEWPQART